MKSVLLDLDGTLTDSRDGIVGCLEYALSQSGVAVPSAETLAGYIGVPLRNIFRDLMGNPGPDAVEAAVRLYRERFNSVGMYDNRLYPGVLDMLEGIRDKGWLAYVVTSKAEAASRRVVSHFELDRFFAAVHGSDMDGARADKGELIQYVLETESVRPADAVMVGDRSNDVKGALANGVPAVGVTYGYGTRDELMESGATWVCDEPCSVLRVLMEHFGDTD
jgi:phosphoglycolate phosphatase